jgi:hypothetical protein
VDRGIVTVAGNIESIQAQQCLRGSLPLVPGVVRVDWKVEAPSSTG